MNGESLTTLDLLRREEENRFSFRLFVLIGLIFVMVGRIQESELLLPIMAPIHLGALFQALSIPVMLNLAKEQKFQLINPDFPEMKLLLVLFGIGLMSMPFSVYRYESFIFMLSSFLKLILLFFLTVNLVRSHADLHKVVWSYIIFMIVLTVPVLFFKRGGIPDPDGGALVERWSSSANASYDPNDLCLMIVVAFPFVIHFIPRNRGVKKLILMAAIPLFLVAMVATVSRGGFIGLVVVLTLMLYRSRRLNLFQKTGIILLLLISFFYCAPESFQERIRGIGVVEDYNTTYKFGRMQVWQRNLKTVVDHPLLGVGPGCFNDANGILYGEEVGGMAWRVTAHNSFLLLAVEFGLIGLALYLAFFLKSMARMRRFQREAEENHALDDHVWFARALEASLVGFMVCAFFLSFCYNAIAYFLVGLGVAYSRILMISSSIQSEVRDHD